MAERLSQQRLNVLCAGSIPPGGFLLQSHSKPTIPAVFTAAVTKREIRDKLHGENLFEIAAHMEI